MDTPVMAAFREYAKELDDKHDRYERIVKMSRDITIESKRIIFLLHTIETRRNNREKVLEDAEKRLRAVCETNFLLIARELEDLDQNQYLRAFSPGLQEFIEAYSYFEYLKDSSKLSDWDDLQQFLTYNIDKPSSTKENETKEEKSLQEQTVAKKQIVCTIKPVEFILGLADLGGEIMRRCINSLGSGDIDSCFQACRTLQTLYAGYLRIRPVGNREIPRKITTLRQSTLKAENVCYNIKVRGGEAASWDTLDTAGFAMDKIAHDDEDEGFY